MATFVPLVESSDVLTIDFVAEITPRFAVEVLPVPLLVEETVTLFIFVPEVVPVTVTVTVQLLFIAIDAPLKLMLDPFAAAVTVPPVQVVETFGTAAFCKPDGYVSVKATPVKETVFAAGFVIVNVIVVEPLTAIELAANTLAIVGGATTVTVFEPMLLASLDSSILLFGSTVAVFARLPPAVGVTAKVTLNEPPAGIVTAPLASQLRAVPAIEQLIVPAGGVAPFVMVNAP